MKKIVMILLVVSVGLLVAACATPAKRMVNLDNGEEAIYNELAADLQSKGIPLPDIGALTLSDQVSRLISAQKDLEWAQKNMGMSSEQVIANGYYNQHIGSLYWDKVNAKMSEGVALHQVKDQGGSTVLFAHSLFQKMEGRPGDLVRQLVTNEAVNGGQVVRIAKYDDATRILFSSGSIVTLDGKGNIWYRHK